MNRTAEETALLIALLLKRSNQKRARISIPTIRRLAKRRHIRGAFIEMLTLHLGDLGVVLVELDRGGYGLIPSDILNGAPAITAKKYLKDELADLRKGFISFESIKNELEGESDFDDEDE